MMTSSNEKPNAILSLKSDLEFVVQNGLPNTEFVQVNQLLAAIEIYNQLNKRRGVHHGV